MSLYKTYNYQGSATAIIKENQSIRNWYLNEVMNLSCNRRFLGTYTSPEITVVSSSWMDNPYLDKKWALYQFAKGYINPIIRELINNGYYVYFTGADDYYIEGKSWYKELHRRHDGLICGYDQQEKTYSIYSHDKNWVYQKFKTPQKCFKKACEATAKNGIYAVFCGIKPKADKIELCPKTICKNLKEYLDSSLEKYPMELSNEDVYGIIVHKFIAEYLNKLLNGTFPHNRMDRRVFRLIWEHKKQMLERIKAVEEKLGWDEELSKRYKWIEEVSNQNRIMYAAYNLRKRDSLLETIRENLLKIMTSEEEILKEMIAKIEKE